MDRAIVDNAKAYVVAIFSGNAGGHDAEHTFRVHRNAISIARESGIEDTLTIELAALLHDVDDHKLFDTVGNANARAFLASESVPQSTIDEICDIIEHVSFSKNRGRQQLSIQAQIVQDADRLDAIGAIGIARTFAYGGEHGRPLSASVEHFHEKLLLLKDLMNTDAAKAMAQRRHEFMESYLKELSEEM